MASTDLRALLNTPLADAIRRRRRIVAAVCAGAAALLALTVIRTPAPSIAEPQAPTLAADEVAVPITMMSGAVAEALTQGDHIDVVAIPRTGDGAARLIAREATVMSVAANGGFGATATPVVVVAVSRPIALSLADAMSAHTFTAWVTGTIPAQPDPAR